MSSSQTSVGRRLPLVDLKAQYALIKPEIDKAIAEVVDAQYFVLGPAVKRFEAEFAQYCGVRHCIGLQSGTTAVWLALLAAGVRPGDEVITTPHTFFGTIEGILLCGAKPVFADIDARTLNISPALADAAVTPRTKALLPVHIYGQPVDMDAFRDIANRHRLALIEDAAQAVGSDFRGKRAGAMGDAAAFSFYPGKNLGAYGDAGAVLTDSDETAARLRRLRDHGAEKKNHHEIVGANSRMDDIQAAVLSVKLRHIDRWNELRRAHAASYRKALEGTRLTPIEEIVDGTGNSHLFVARHPDRDGLLKKLRSEGIEADVHYPIACHRQKALGSAMLPEGSLPESERAVKQVISLPLFPEMTKEQIERVAGAVRSFDRG